jgi:hypothetical protein
LLSGTSAFPAFARFAASSIKPPAAPKNRRLPII